LHVTYNITGIENAGNSLVEHLMEHRKKHMNEKREIDTEKSFQEVGLQVRFLPKFL